MTLRRRLGLVFLNTTLLVLALAVWQYDARTQQVQLAVASAVDPGAGYGCSATGLPEDVIPGGAVVRDPNGNERHTSFDEGWATYVHKTPGVLLSVCLR